ncbi:MAG: IS110 family transposase [Nitrospira sp.]|nr:IS110 family transposase [Nitrospira sp.]
MEYIALGCDISKGRCDVAIINQSGTLLQGSGGYDDIRRDHERLRTVITELRESHPDAQILVGLEATGGLERNWLSFFRVEKRWEKFVLVHRLNPLMVKRYLESDLHRAVNDQSAARGIARFLLERMQKKVPTATTIDGNVTLHRWVRTQISRQVEAIQRLQTLLPVVHPDLVRYCRSGIPAWVLMLVEQYPTAIKLARARVDVVERIPHIDAARAGQVIAAAQTSVASLSDPGAEAAMRCLVEEIHGLDRSIEQGKATLTRLLAGDPRIGWLESIPGIGTWSAITLALEIGDVSRFPTARSLIAWAGLDPREDISGDGTVRHGISHRGNAQVRALLFMNALSAIVHNPTIASFFQRLTTGESAKPKKLALVACAAKILRIAYALLCSQRTFDPDHERNRAAQAAAARQDDRSASSGATASTTVVEAAPLNVDAPITAKEAKRRRKRSENAAAPCPKKCEVRPHAGSGAAAPPVSAPQAAAKRRVQIS